MEQERLKARRPSVVPQSWRHGWNWAQDNAVNRSVIVGQVGCKYNEIFVCLFQGVCKALNTWSPLCAFFFLSFSLSLSLSGLLSPHTVCIRCATLSPGGSRGTGTANESPRFRDLSNVQYPSPSVKRLSMQRASHILSLWLTPADVFPSPPAGVAHEFSEIGARSDQTSSHCRECFCSCCCSYCCFRCC